MDQDIKSRPRYGAPRLDPAGLRHLVVTDQAAFLPAAFAAAADRTELWTVGPSGSGFAASSFATPASLISALAERLAAETTGFRLYAAGTEAFIWDAGDVARAAGLVAGEFFLHQVGSLRRRVYCTHCKANADEVTTSLVSCPGCGARLFVRDHFSRRLRAFMGVQVDAEIPGDRPVAAELYP